MDAERGNVWLANADGPGLDRRPGTVEALMDGEQLAHEFAELAEVWNAVGCITAFGLCASLVQALRGKPPLGIGAVTIAEALRTAPADDGQDPQLVSRTRQAAQWYLESEAAQAALTEG